MSFEEALQEEHVRVAATEESQARNITYSAEEHLHQENRRLAMVGYFESCGAKPLHDYAFE